MKDFSRHLARSLIRAAVIAGAVALIYAWVIATYPLP